MKSRAAVAAIVVFIIAATASAALTVRLTARAIDETAAVQAAEAPEIARLYIATYGSLAAAAPSIVKRVTRDGLRVTLFDLRTHTVYGAAGIIRGPFRRFGNDAPGGRGLSDGAPPPGLQTPGAGTPAGPPGASIAGNGGFGDGPPPPPDGGGGRRSDSWAFFIADLAGEMPHRAAIPGGAVNIFPEPEPILAVVRTVALGLAFVLLCSGALLWLYMRGIRRAAIRPLTETTLALRRLAQRDFSPRTITAGEGSAYDDLARAYNAAVEAVSSAFAERRAAEIEMQRFVADAGHELRTPLTIVMGYLDIIAGGALADPSLAGRIGSGMRTETLRMRKLIDKLIILARMETPSDADVRTDVDVVSLAQRVIETLEPLAVQPIEVGGLLAAHVFVNEDDLAEALTNIIENGLKYAPLSPIDVRVGREAENIVIDIADRGPGMSTDEAHHAFERFYRGDQRGEISGSGLGLAIAKRGIERSRGTIHLRSFPGTGTTFRIELPEAPAPAANAGPARLARH